MAKALDEVPPSFGHVEALIDKIDELHKKLKVLHQNLEGKKKCLFALHLSNKVKNRDVQISYIEITVHRNIFELNRVREKEINIKNSEEYVFLAIEIFIPKYLQTIFIDNKFQINILTMSGNESMSKTIPVSEYIMHEVIPIKILHFFHDISITFFGKICGKNLTVKTPIVNTDISYFVNNYNNRISLSDRLGKLCTLYRPQRKNLLKEYSINCQLSTSMTKEQFLEILSRNSYNYMNVTTFMFDDKNAFYLANNNFKTYITYRTKSNVLQIESSIFNLHQLKKLFINSSDILKKVEEAKVKKLSNFNMDNHKTSIGSYKTLRTLVHRK